MSNDSNTTDPRVEAAAAAMWEQRPMMRTADGAPQPWAEVPAWSYGERYRGQARAALAAADAVDAHEPRTITVDPAGREQLVNLLLTHRGTPRERLFEYPYRTDESWELIQQAEAAVTDVIKILNSQPEAEATNIDFALATAKAVGVSLTERQARDYIQRDEPEAEVGA